MKSSATRAVQRGLKPSRATGFATGVAASMVFMFGASATHAAAAYPTAKTPAAHDLGALVSSASAAPITVTVALKLRNTAELDALMKALYTPGNPGFHQFLSAEQFHQRFSPSQDTIAAATAYFTHAGLAVKVDAGHLLKVTGTPGAVQAAFNVSLHEFEVPSVGAAASYRFRAPVGAPSIGSPAVAATVAAVIGLDNQPRYAPHSLRATEAVPALRQVPAAGPGATPDAAPVPGFLTVTDVARRYNVEPLYAQGFHGEGRTVGIVTLASFTPSDAFTYWASLGLPVASDRITIVDVDGGPGLPSDASGSDETTLDVQQSGGMAPAAKVIVYQSPNTDQAFVDAFAKAVDDNIADTISVSWGSFEWYDTVSKVKQDGHRVDALQAFDNVFVQAAAQGQSLFASSGDAGAYEANRGDPVPQYSKTLSVGAPASSAWITAAGGTTLPGTQTYGLPDGSTVAVHILHEQAWGWSYLTNLCFQLGYNPVSCGIFPVGGGGGVSSYVPVPSYQAGVPGIHVTEAGQSLISRTYGVPIDLVDLPAGYAGRNLPDVSLNADPETGFSVDYTSDQTGYGVLSYVGGTSFVAPQLNGIAALLSQAAKGRIGLLNYPLYSIAGKANGYNGLAAPLIDITHGDNWFYDGVAGYDAATGVGTLNVANFARALVLMGH